MKSPAIIAFIFFGMFISRDAISQDDDGCAEILRNVPRDISVESQNDGTALKIADKFCQNGSAKSSGSVDLGFGAVIESIPIKFNLGAGSTEEKQNQFCKDFNSDYTQNISRYVASSRAAAGIPEAWLSCKSLAVQGVMFKPRISQTLIVIEIAKKTPSPVSVQGVSYDPALLNCSVPNTKTRASRVKASEKTVKTLSEQYWPIFCKRIPMDENGQKVYPRVDVGIATTKGSFLLPVQADALPSYKWSSEIQSDIERLTAALADMKVKMNNRISGIVLTESDPITLQEFGCAGQAIAPKPLQVMYGTRDGTSCNVTNLNWVKTLGVSIPPAQ